MRNIIPFVVFVIVFAILSYFEVSLITSISISLIIGVINQKVLNFESSFKDFEISEITSGETNELMSLFNREIESIEIMGYNLFDEFAIKNNKSLANSIFYNNPNSTTLISFTQLKIFNGPISISISTLFNDSTSLTTTNSKMFGNLPFIEKYFIQIFNDEGLEQILEKHLQSVSFLHKNGFESISYDTNLFRNYTIEENKMIYESLGQFPLLKSFFYMLNDKYKDYAKLIEDQDLDFEVN